VLEQAECEAVHFRSIRGCDFSSPHTARIWSAIADPSHFFEFTACARNDVVEAVIYPTGKSIRAWAKSMSSPAMKNILIFRNNKSSYISRHPVPIRGALRGRHGRWVRDAVDADGAADESA
jgi:hypothetical protein